jgi:LPXTG-motif cell wall-anchored protein
MKKKMLFVILSLFMILPLSVYAGGIVDCSDVNDSSVKNNWEYYSNESFDTLNRGYVYYCKTKDKSDSKYNQGDIFELIYNSDAHGKYRIYCLNGGLDAPTDSTLSKVVTAWDVGPACAFYKYNGTGDAIRHNRIRYIQSKCKIKCKNSDDSSSTCCDNETQCTDDFISDDCVGYRKSEPDDSGNSIKLSNLTDITEETSSDDYFIYSVSVTKSGSVGSYTPSISPSISGAFVTDSISGTSSVTDTSASNLYVKIPKSSVTSSMTSNLKVVANYTISCTYKKFGLTYYKPTKNGVTVAGEQRVGFRTVKEFNPSENKTKEATISFALTPESSTIDYINVKKIDADDNSLLSGATIGLYSDSECTTSASDVFGNSSVTTDGSGSAYFFVESDSGTYYLKELSAPSGYMGSTTCKEASIDGTTTFENTKVIEEVYGKIIVNKKDMTNSTPIEGVKFEVLMSDMSTSATDKDGNTIGVVTTDSDGKIEIPNLNFGTYYLKEISTLENYIMSEEPTEVVVNKEEVSVVIENALRYITFIKRDSVSKDAIAGGKYRIIDESGESVAEFTMDDGTYFMDIAAGKYTFIEVTPPKGYNDDNVTFEFEVTDGGIINITSNDDRHYYVSENMALTIINDKEETIINVPKTGVFNNKVVVVIGILLVVGGVSSIIIIKRKNS